MKQPAKRGFVLELVAAAIILNTVGAMAYVSYVDEQRKIEEREADQRWCSLMTTLDDRYSKLTPVDADQAQLFREIKEIRMSLNCP